MPTLALPFPNFDPILIQIGPFAIRWYALAYIVGILLGWFYARRLIRNERMWGGPAPLTTTDFDDFVLWVTLGIILGGRLGYVMFYNPGHFLQHPLEILQLWAGGMSFHGGFAGCVVAVAGSGSGCIHSVCANVMPRKVTFSTKRCCSTAPRSSTRCVSTGAIASILSIACPGRGR